jgi:hypothetical protein
LQYDVSLIKNNPPFWVANTSYYSDYYTAVEHCNSSKFSNKSNSRSQWHSLALTPCLLLICQWRKSTNTCGEMSLSKWKMNVGPSHKVLQYQNEYPLYPISSWPIQFKYNPNLHSD